MAYEKYIVGIIICVIGFSLTIFGYFKFVKPVRDMIKNSGVTAGVITSDETNSGYITGDSPIVEYTVSPGGEVYREPVGRSWRIMRYKNGERIRLFYNLNRPSEPMLTDTLVLYGDAIKLSMFTLPILLFGWSMLALRILGRDSFFDLGSQLKNGIPSSVHYSVTILSGLCVILLALKFIADMPACMNTGSYTIITFSILFVLNIVSFIVLLRLDQKK